MIKKAVRRLFGFVLAAALVTTLLAVPAAAVEAQLVKNPSIQIVWPDMMGDQEGVITLDEEAGAWRVDFENPFGKQYAAGTYQQDGTMEVTDDGGAGEYLPAEAICTAGGEAIAKYYNGEEVTLVETPVIEEEKEPECKSEELILKNGDQDIYGVMYLPLEEQETYPVIILSHGFGSNSDVLKSLAQFYAENGFAAYAFDFIGGGDGSRSGKADGDMTGMSVLTEAADLSAVMDQLAELPYIDAGHLFLFGQSQGGYISAYTAAQRPENVTALILQYPAFALQDDCWERHGSIENIPETEEVMDQTLGAIFSKDAMSMDIYEVIGGYTGDVLLAHGDSDTLVDISYSEKALGIYENATLLVYEGQGHGFVGEQMDKFEQDSLNFLNNHLN